MFLYMHHEDFAVTEKKNNFRDERAQCKGEEQIVLFWLWFRVNYPVKFTMELELILIRI